MTPQEIFDTKISAKIKSKPDMADKVNAVYRFDLSGPTGGVWIVDLKKGGTNGVRQADEQGQCTILMSDTDFVSLVDGSLAPQKAFMGGKLKVKGDMSLAMKLTSVLT